MSGSPGGPAQSPVFILTTARSGSTLMRLILDTHPELACPPETGVASACGQLAKVMGILDGLFPPSPAGARSITTAAGTSIRELIDSRFAAYASSRGKQRWCDKSLDNVLLADLLAQIWPDAQFICMSRHCMDVVASCIEACPWGLTAYGLEQYAAQHPGNSVAAVAAYWVNTTGMIQAFRQKYPDRCHLVRYEDLVTDAEQIIAELITFLGIRQDPGVTVRCFQHAHDGGGPGDEKIWFTDSIGAQSLGRGVQVPVTAIPSPMLAFINEQLTNLGYRTVPPDWNALPELTDPRSSYRVTRRNGPVRSATAAGVWTDVARRLAGISDEKMADIVQRWPQFAGRALGIEIYDAAIGARKFYITLDEVRGGKLADEAAAWEEDCERVIGNAGSWAAALNGASNFFTEFVHGRLRVVNGPQTLTLRPGALHVIAELLECSALDIP